MLLFSNSGIRHRNIRIIFLFLCAFLPLRSFADDNWGPPAGAKPDYSVVYTGRLFGYFRYPDVQTTDQTGCPGLARIPLPIEVAQFRSTLQKLRSQKQVLVSMGDNFAPEMPARMMRNEIAGTLNLGELVDKDVFQPAPDGGSWYRAAGISAQGMQALTESEGKVPSDNVGCFLRLMGFDAVVPGEQDFYYGPERLREIARFLAEPGGNGYSRVEMLAANLSISSMRRSATPPLPAGMLRPRIRETLAGGAVRADLPSNVMPWLKEITIKGNARELAAFDCIADADNPVDFRLPSEAGNNCTQLRGDAAGIFRFEAPAHPSNNFVSGQYSLDPGSNHALCLVYEVQGRQATHCQLFSVQYPFFQYHPHASGTTPALYYLSSDPNGPAIFGVLDPDLAGYIGELNSVWRNQDARFDTTIQIGDPVEALRQILQLCDADKNCKNRPKILLAQMPYYKGSELAAKLKEFSAVISQPDQEHATEEQYVARADRNESAYLLTPGFSFETSRQNPLSVNLRRADFYFETRGDNEAREFIANRVEDGVVIPESSEQCPECKLNTAVAALTKTNPPNVSKSYQTLALMAMQKFCGADIALLQHRDVFSRFGKSIEYWPRDLRHSSQQLLDEALWKGDFAFCVPVKGSTIKKILEESAAFDQQDQSNLSIETEKGRGLSTLGIQTDPTTGAPTIRGEAILDNKLYGVAMTDYLAFGNTGYPELSTEAIQPVVRVVSLRGLNRLTGLACEQLPRDLTNGFCQADEIDSSDYFDAIRQRPFDTSRGLTAWLQFVQWASHPVQPQPSLTTFFEKKPNTPENAVERRGLWWFDLQNIALEYDLSFIGGSDKTVPGNFSGINTFSQLSTPESSNLSIWTRARGGYSFPKFVDFYMAGEAKYGRLAVRSSINNGNFGPYQLSLSSNVVRGEIGLVTKPLYPRIPIRLLASENLLTQVTTPFQQFTVPVPCVEGNCANRQTSLATYDLGKNMLVLTRLGARIQNEHGWFEAGREYGQNVGVPVSFSLIDPGQATPYPCKLSGSLSLSQCVAGDPNFTTASQIRPDLQNQYVAGWFMDFHSEVPLYRSKLQLMVDSYGEIYDKMKTDTTFNTRYYEDFILSLKVPIWGNLSFSPQVETFFFQNKIVPNQPALTNHYVFVTSSIKLQYGFNWHRGVGVLRALRYPNGISTVASPSVPTP